MPYTPVPAMVTTRPSEPIMQIRWFPVSAKKTAPSESRATPEGYESPADKRVASENPAVPVPA